MLPRRFRTVFPAAFAVGGIVLLVIATHQFFLLLTALFAPHWEVTLYDLGFYGAFPQQSYVSFNLTSPRVSRVRWNEQCDKGFIMITPHGNSVPREGPVLLDTAGQLVWMSEKFGMAADFKVQQYRGENYLTFWSGRQVATHGLGTYYMLDSSYKTAYHILPVGSNVDGDLHDFKLTEQGTAIVTIYNTTNADLSSIGRPVHGWLTDSVFQEIDIATGELIFEWRASDHFHVNESYRSDLLGGYSSGKAFDFFHINSVDKDSMGNYLVSSRHLHALIMLNPAGEVQWVLGGKRNEFKDLSDGAAVGFSWQHDARWLSEDEGILTMFDNGGAGILQTDFPYSQGKMIQLDIGNRTASLLHTYVSLKHTRATSQGSLQVLPDNGNIFIGWGHSAAYSEFDPDGTLLCESHFGPSSLDIFDRIVSYRAFKAAEWTATPDYPPSAKIQASNLFVSWNGATEVAAWELQGLAEGDHDFQPIDVIEKLGFEGSFPLPPEEYASYRVAALDKNGVVLAHSNAVFEDPDWAMPEINYTLVLIIGLVVCVSVLFRRSIYSRIYPSRR